MRRTLSWRLSVECPLKQNITSSWSAIITSLHVTFRADGIFLLFFVRRLFPAKRTKNCRQFERHVFRNGPLFVYG